MNLTMSDREEELRRGSCYGEVGRSPAGVGEGTGARQRALGGRRGGSALAELRLTEKMAMVAPRLRAGKRRFFRGMERGGRGGSYRGGGRRREGKKLANPGGEASWKFLPWLEKEMNVRKKKEE